MSLTVQTNIASMIAQQNLSVNSDFMTQTITRLTSGYRINSSADDAAGLSIANQYRSNIAELTQGVRNGNDGVSALQIVDGGLNNISTILDRLKTLATQSSSGTFSGDRNTLNNEYQGLLGEITRQASNVGLNVGGQYNSILQVFIGGSSTLSNAQVSVNLSGASNAVDSVSLGLSTTSVLGGGTGFASNTVNNLNNPNALFDTTASSGTETFTVTYVDAQGQVASPVTLTINASTNGISGTSLVSSLNTQLANSGVTGVSAQIGSDGTLQFTGGNLLSVAHATTGTISSTAVSTGATTPMINAANYNSTGAFTAFAAGTGTGASDTSETFQVTVGGVNHTVTLSSSATNSNQQADTQAHAISAINTQLAGTGVYAVANGTGNITLQSNSSFTLTETSFTQGAGATTLGTGGLFYGYSAPATTFGTTGAQTITAANNNASATGNAQLAISAIDAAIKQLGFVQGRVGAGENSLQYAMNLANSQISSYSAAQSRIRDADMAAEAANLTKAQILEQSSIAAMAQANSAPQAVLALLK